MVDLVNVISEAIDERLSDINTAMPAIIQSYNANNYTCSVKPSINKKYLDELILEYPIIYNVPVLFPRTSLGAIHMPLKQGDKVQLLINQRDLDAYLNSGNIEEPNTNRKFNLQDAVVILGLYSNSTNQDNDEALTVRYNQAFLKITEDNQVNINATNINITGNLNVDGETTITESLTVVDSISATGVISSDDDVTADGVSLKTHTHGGVTSGGASTLPPN